MTRHHKLLKYVLKFSRVTFVTFIWGMGVVTKYALEDPGFDPYMDLRFLPYRNRLDQLRDPPSIH